MHSPLLTSLVILFLLSILVTTFCARLKLPAIVGFLLTGVLCGPSGIGVVQDVHSVDTLAEIGVAFLLFGIGLELSGDALNRLKKPVFLGGTVQLGLTIATVAGLFLLLGRDMPTSIIGGCLIALSSSAIVLRLLQEKGTTETPQGRLSLAILVFQDIMAVPILLLIPIITGQQAAMTLQNILASLGKIALVGGGVYLFARFGLERLMLAVVRTRISELLQLTTLGLCMGLALLSDWLGLSLSLGAFLAGLLLARSEYSLSVLSGIMPYRDVFMSIFFISVGMLVDIGHVLADLPALAGLTALFILIKCVCTLPAVLMQNYPLRTGIIVSLSLAQIGEFSFVLADAADKAGIFSTEGYYQDFLSMSIMTMLATPILMSAAPKLADRIDRLRGKELETREDDSSHAARLRDHLIIIGFGISGKYLAGAARQTGLPYEILEMNPDTVARYREIEPIYHGDAKQPAVLEHLGVKTAMALTIVISDPAAVRAITVEARKMNPSLHIVARTRYLGEVEALHKLGADNVVAEEFESAIEVFSRVLGHFLVPRREIDAMAAKIRKENYEMLRAAPDRAAPLGALVDQLPDVGVNAFKVEPHSEIAGRNLVDAALRKRFNVNIVALKRGKEMMAPPDARAVFEVNDTVYAFGSTEDLRRLGAIFMEREQDEQTGDLMD